MPKKPIGPLCKRPFTHPGTGLSHGCGQCMPCLIGRRRTWSHRLMLEAFKTADMSFLTLTYNDENLPKGGTLQHADFQKFIKKLRKKGFELRFYMCGEYGEITGRPHYHAALYGLGPAHAQQIEEAWGRGGVFVGDLTHDSAQYIVGYVTKKMNHPESKCTPQCKHPPLNGRKPEYQRSSNGGGYAKVKGGIGAPAIADIQDVLTTGPGCDALARVGDVPHALTLGKKSFPLGRYIRGKLRVKMGFGDARTPVEALNAYKAKMQELQKYYVATSKETPLSKYLDSRAKYQKFLIDQAAQKVLQLETRNKIFSAKKDKL